MGSIRPHTLLTTMATLALLVGCSQQSGQEQTSSVALIGDSLAQETEPYLRQMLDPTPLVNDFFGGTAPCDWLDKDLHLDGSSIAVISFIGNSGTPCMADANGSFPRGQALIDRYRADLDALVAKALTAGARVVLVGQPQRGDPGGEPEVTGINEISLELAQRDGVTLVDAGAAVENIDGSLATVLPCLPEEASCGPDGNNVVRNDDGVHLCPGSAADACPDYSSGAFRFATAIALAVLDL